MNVWEIESERPNKKKHFIFADSFDETYRNKENSCVDVALKDCNGNGPAALSGHFVWLLIISLLQSVCAENFNLWFDCAMNDTPKAWSIFWYGLKFKYDFVWLALCEY